MLLSLTIATNAHFKRAQLQTKSIIENNKMTVDPKQHHRFIDQFRKEGQRVYLSAAMASEIV